MDVLLLRFDAPLMSFGDVAVDHHRPTGRFPALSLLAGLLANALGWRRAEADRHQRLQERLRVAARIDRRGSLLRDYQSVDLGQPFLRDAGWTTRDRMEERSGADQNKTGTHLRYRYYWADCRTTVALALDPPGEPPTLDDLSAALRAPARPLFLGRKSCLPAGPILLGRWEAASLRGALEAVERAAEADPGALPAVWPGAEGGGEDEGICWDLRDWVNQVHTGSRRVRYGTVSPPWRSHE
ncbi:MAG TPA: type I-E CRISPR-associated protein Cas5/CasD [Dehalococcoidia bacterium]